QRRLRSQHSATQTRHVKWNIPWRLCVLSRHGGGSQECVTRLIDFSTFAKARLGFASTSLCCSDEPRKLGRPLHHYWRMQFCSLPCVAAYQQRLSKHTIQKILHLESSALRAG